MKLTKTVTTERLFLKDLDNYIHDWGYPQIVIEVGEEIDVAVEEFDDGRVYYTAFRFDKGHIFVHTRLRDVEGVVWPNCGLWTSENTREVKALLQKGGTK